MGWSSGDSLRTGPEIDRERAALNLPVAYALPIAYALPRLPRAFGRCVRSRSSAHGVHKQDQVEHGFRPAAGLTQSRGRGMARWSDRVAACASRTWMANGDLRSGTGSATHPPGSVAVSASACSCASTTAPDG